MPLLKPLFTLIFKFICSLLVLIAVGQSSYAQTYLKDKGVVWELSKPSEQRLKFRFGTSGINIGGYEGTTLIVENITSQDLYVEVKLTIKDYCGGTKLRTVKLSVKANSKKGGSTWMGGDEQYDYSTTCTEKKKYDTNFSTKIVTVGLEIVSVRETGKMTGTTGTTTSTTNTTGNTTSTTSTTTTSTTSTTNGTTSGNRTQPCPTYGFKITPSFNCVAMQWWALSDKVNMIDANGNFKQAGNPDASYFTIQFRKQGDLDWNAERRNNTGNNSHALAGLEACTKYEVRLITTCENGAVSEPTSTVRFTTLCTPPNAFTIENIRDNSAQINNGRVPGPTLPCGAPKTQIRIIEFKTTTTAWDEVICNSGSPCFLSALEPGTTYRVRARYKYGNNIYSNYTNEASFTTTGQKSNSKPYTGGGSGSNPSTGPGGSTGPATGTLKVPTVIGPTNGTKVTGYYLELSWNGVLGASSYEVLLATKSNFSDAISFTSTNTKLAPSNFGKATTYYWKVRAKGPDGKFSFWSSIARFTF